MNNHKGIERRIKMRTLLLVVMVSIILVAVPMESYTFDGTRWKLMESNEKIAYLLGFYDGLISQRQYGSEYTEYITWKMSYVDMAREIDKFYADYKNLNIEVGDALIIFNAGIRGLSDRELEEMKRLFRQLRSGK